MFHWLSFLFIGTLGWGVSLYLIKILLVSLTPTEIVLYRMAIGTITLFILAYLLQLKIHHFRHLVTDGLVIGIFNMTLPFYLTSWAEKNISSSLASMLNGLTPLCTFVLGVVFFIKRQPVNIFNLLSILMGLIGILLINWDFTISKNSTDGLLELITASISYGIAANYVRSFAKTKEPILMAAMGAFISTMMMLFYKLREGPLNWHIPHHATQIAALCWLGIIGSGLCLYLYCSLIQKIGAMKASTVTYLMTLTGVSMGIILLHERMDRLLLLGCLFIVMSLILVNHVTTNAKAC